MKKTKSFSSKMKPQWIIATVIGIYLAPVCLIWYIINTIREVKHSREANRVILYCGLGILAFSIFCYTNPSLLSAAAKTDSTHIVLILLACDITLGVYLITTFLVLSRRSKRLSAIFHLIQTEHITSVSKIADITGFNQSGVVKSINSLIALGELKNAYLEGDELILTESIWAHQLVTCKSCGAELTVNYGQTLICEFCGGALSYHTNDNRTMDSTESDSKNPDQIR